MELPVCRLLGEGGASVRGLVLDGRDQADLAVEPPEVEPVDVRVGSEDCAGGDVGRNAAARLLARRPPGQGRDWHVARTDLLATRLDELDLDDFVVDNDGGRTGREVVQEVLSRLGWVDRLVALGAARQDGGGDGVVVLADPDGVEFRVSTG